MKKQSLAFWTCLICSTLLFIGGFLVPPMGVIDNSVLKACGMLLGFGSLAQAPNLIESLERAKFTKGDITLELQKEKRHDTSSQSNS